MMNPIRFGQNMSAPRPDRGSQINYFEKANTDFLHNIEAIRDPNIQNLRSGLACLNKGLAKELTDIKNTQAQVLQKLNEIMQRRLDLQG